MFWMTKHDNFRLIFHYQTVSEQKNFFSRSVHFFLKFQAADSLKVFENLGATSVAPVAPVVTSLTQLIRTNSLNKILEKKKINIPYVIYVS